MKRFLLPFILATSSVGFVQVSSAADRDANQVGGITLKQSEALAKKYPMPSAWLLANSCSGCHGTKGSEFDDIMPPLAGIDKQEFIKKMHEYKTQDPNSFIAMGIITQPLTDAEIEAMADYFSKQKPVEWTNKNWRANVKNPSWATQTEGAK